MIVEEEEEGVDLGKCGEDASLLEGNEMRLVDAELMGLKAIEKCKVTGGNYEEVTKHLRVAQQGVEKRRQLEMGEGL